MAKIIKAVIQLRRGESSEWSTVNPVLRLAEPGYAIDTGELRIGDGKTAWNDLPIANSSGVINAATHLDFPSVGKSNVLYKADTEKLIYQWNDAELKYEPLSSGPINVDDLQIDIINGGNANGK